jgi:hypothetical protein
MEGKRGGRSEEMPLSLSLCQASRGGSKEEAR